MNVLIVEDSTINQALARHLFGRLGCTVDVASTGHEAVRAFCRNRYDLILMDCLLPGLDGCAATRIIRSLERDRKAMRRVPIIGLTACSEPNVEARCLRAGMDLCYRKPLCENILKEIQPWLGASNGASSFGKALA